MRKVSGGSIHGAIMVVVLVVDLGYIWLQEEKGYSRGRGRRLRGQEMEWSTEVLGGEVGRA